MSKKLFLIATIQVIIHIIFQSIFIIIKVLLKQDGIGTIIMAIYVHALGAYSVCIIYWILYERKKK
jgi:hypothetical protein